jgi:hypothetical protein
MNSPFLVHRIEHWLIDRLLSYSKNSRIHSEMQLAQIAASIRLFGFVNPILIGPDGRIVAGHARVSAARIAGLTEVPVIVLDHLSPAQMRALVIADNPCRQTDHRCARNMLCNCRSVAASIACTIRNCSPKVRVTSSRATAAGALWLVSTSANFIGSCSLGGACGNDELHSLAPCS